MSFPVIVVSVRPPQERQFVPDFRQGLLPAQLGLVRQPDIGVVIGQFGLQGLDLGLDDLPLPFRRLPLSFKLLLLRRWSARSLTSWTTRDVPVSTAPSPT